MDRFKYKRLTDISKAICDYSFYDDKRQNFLTLKNIKTLLEYEGIVTLDLRALDNWHRLPVHLKTNFRLDIRRQMNRSLSEVQGILIDDLADRDE